MADIEKYSAAFPDSKFQDQVSSYAMYTLGPGQLNDQARLVAYGEKMLAANPNSLPALLLLAGTYVDSAQPGSVGKAITTPRKRLRWPRRMSRMLTSLASCQQGWRIRFWGMPTSSRTRQRRRFRN